MTTSATEAAPVAAAPHRRLWNRSFLLLWQGQLVSALGDQVYAIALGFWILQTTGSTALMGTLLAVSALPRVLVAPFAGVLVDRSDRTRTLIATDIVRGLVVVLVALAAYGRMLEVWMVFGAGIVIGIGGAFFNPAVGSAVPDIVPRDRIVQANSAYQLLYTGASVFGSAAGGFLYQLLGAPLMFLVNGLSYLVSSGTLFFTRIPPVVARGPAPHFFADLRAGFALVWRVVGLRTLFLVAAVLNFIAVMGIVLLLPFFERTPGLGPARYGVAMAVFAVGLSVGFIAMSSRAVPPARRFGLFMLGGIVTPLAMAVVPFVASFPVMVGLLLVAGLANAVLNALIPGTVQLVVPQEMRGKVFALLGALASGLMPLAMALAGGLAEVIPLPTLISICFGLTLVVFLPLPLMGSVRRFINFDPATQKVDDLQARPRRG